MTDREKRIRKQLEDETAERRENEKRTPTEVRSGAISADDDGPPTVAVSMEKMLNLPERVGIGSLRVFVKALPKRAISNWIDSLFSFWPVALILASKTPLLPDGSIDCVAVAELSTEVARSLERDKWDAERARIAGEYGEESAQIGDLGTAEEAMAIAPVYSARDVASDLADVYNNLESYAPGIAQSLWPVVSSTPDLTEEALAEIILSQLTLPEISRLPGIVLRANSVGGGYVDDLEQRFTAPCLPDAEA